MSEVMVRVTIATMDGDLLEQVRVTIVGGDGEDETTLAKSIVATLEHAKEFGTEEEE